MKIRNSYVSNSSSCSFIVKKDLSEFGISCLKLTVEQLKRIDGITNWNNEVFKFEEGMDYYLTEFISDSNDNKYDIAKENKIFEYDDGGHGGPYDEDYYNEYEVGWNSVWLRKEHDTAKEMKIKDFIKTFKEQYGKECRILVDYVEGNKFTITIKDEDY